MKKCVVCGREYKSGRTGHEMCQKHYKQLKKYGKVLDNNPRTKSDPNEIIEYDDYAEIILYNKDCEEVARALIDLEDIDKVKDYKWKLKDSGYACNNNCGYLHRFIMDCPDNMVVDHINHNRLDNRKSNLRICTQQQNSMNAGKRNDNKSGTTGICWDKSRNKWKSYIDINNKRINIGRFNTKEEAIEARKQAELEYFGEYRNDNKDDE